MKFEKCKLIPGERRLKFVSYPVKLTVTMSKRREHPSLYWYGGIDGFNAVDISRDDLRKFAKAILKELDR